MSLSLSLTLLAVAVFAVLAFQAWWRTRQGLAWRRPFVATVSEAPRSEPRIDPELGEVPAGEADAGLRLPTGRRIARLDGLIDVIVPITPESPVSAEIAIAHLPTSRRAGTKTMLVEAQDEATGEWGIPVHGQRYAAFQAGVQLANRSGALNEIEYSEFVQKVQAFAEGIGAMADCPDMLDVVARARELDAFASAADALLSLQLRARGVSWSVGFVQQVAQHHGFVPGSLPGRLVMPGQGEGDPPMLVLSFDPQVALADDPQTALRQVALTLDVAQTPESAEPFPAWHRAATALCEELDATAVDEQGIPVTLHAFDTIGRELAQLYRQLDERGLTAGSAAARRLFS